MVATLPALLEAAVATRHPFNPSRDWAGVEDAVSRVATRANPLIGLYSRYGFHHPGPLGLYLLAPGYHLVAPSEGIWFSAALLNALWAALIVVLARWRGGEQAAWISSAAILLYCSALGIGNLADPWNPLIAMLPLGVVLVGSWAWVGGHRWAVYPVVFAGSLCVQTHVAYAVPVALIGATAVGLRLSVWRSARRRPSTELDSSECVGSHSGPTPIVRSRRLREVAWWGSVAAFALVLWAPPLWQQVLGPGRPNLTAVASGAFHPPDDPSMRGRLPTTEALSDAAQPLAPPPVWWSGLDRTSPRELRRPAQASPWWLGFTAAAVVLAGRRLRRRGDVATLQLLALGVAGSVAGVVAALTIQGTAFDWLLLWVRVPSLVLWAAVLIAMAPSAARLLWPTVVAALLFLAMAATGPLVLRPQAERDHMLTVIRPAVVRAFRHDSGVSAILFFNGEVIGVRVLLDRAGIPWTAPDDPRSGIKVSAVMYVVTTTEEIQRFERDPINTLIVRYNARAEHDHALPADFDLAIFKAPPPPR